MLIYKRKTNSEGCTINLWAEKCPTPELLNRHRTGKRYTLSDAVPKGVQYSEHVQARLPQTQGKAGRSSRRKDYQPNWSSQTDEGRPEGNTRGADWTGQTLECT